MPPPTRALGADLPRHRPCIRRILMPMRLNPPTLPVFLIATLAGILGVASHYTAIPYVSDHTFHVLAGAWALITAATLLRGA